MKLIHPLLPFIRTTLAVQPIIFHGTSVVIVPNKETPAPGDSTVSVSATASGNTSHCQPDAPSFHWYEHAHLLSCSPDSETCTYRTQNFPVRAPVHAKPLPLPKKPIEYTIKPLDIGNRHYGQIAVSYIDDERTGLQVYGVGTRETLKGEECRKALRTLKKTLEEWKLNLGFVLEDVCAGGSGSGLLGHYANSGQEFVVEP